MSGVGDCEQPGTSAYLVEFTEKAKMTSSGRAKAPATHIDGVDLIQSVLSPSGAPVLGLYIHTAAGYLSRSIAATKGFKRVQPHLLGTPAILSVRPGISQTELARYLGGGRAKAGLQVAKCIRLGWVRRVVSTADRRKYTLHMTARGNQVLSDIVGTIELHETLFAARLTTHERVTLKNLLSKLMTA